ncbi:MAG TPA: hypothetical protein VNN15_03965 [Solirubrobacterales bacterium]|nr:hypothetical protein [Solirubrobacterales bacterium]
MDSSAAKAQVPAEEKNVPNLEQAPPSAWLRAIIRAVGFQKLTLDQIRRQVGQLIITPETAAIDEYVHVLVEENVLQETGEPQRFELTEEGRTLLEGVLASPSAD